MRIATTTAEVRETLLLHRDKTWALVPTMGALHAGHLSLVERAKSRADLVVMSIFVNPLQFNSSEDLKKYPRTLERDTKLAGQSGVDVLFVPEVKEIFPYWGSEAERARAATVKAGSMADGLCGATRPGHFDGVVTVVAALFNIIQPSVAVFGEKDFQQLRVVEQLVNDLHFPLQIVAGPLVREPSGLAMSSRNERLSAEERQDARLISKALFDAQAMVTAGVREVSQVRERIKTHLSESPRIKIDYIEIVEVNSLKPLTRIVDEAQALVAAFVGDVRLIDNVRLSAN